MLGYSSRMCLWYSGQIRFTFQMSKITQKEICWKMIKILATDKTFLIDVGTVWQAGCDCRGTWTNTGSRKQKRLKLWDIDNLEKRGKKLQTTFAFAAYWCWFVASLFYISCKLYQMSSSWDSDKHKNCMIVSNLGLSVLSSAWIAARIQGCISSGAHSPGLDALCSFQIGGTEAKSNPAP